SPWPAGAPPLILCPSTPNAAFRITEPSGDPGIPRRTFGWHRGTRGDSAHEVVEPAGPREHAGTAQTRRRLRGPPDAAAGGRRAGRRPGSPRVGGGQRSRLPAHSRGPDRGAAQRAAVV